MVNKIEKARKFYEQKELIRQVILNRLRQSKNVLTGSRAVNRHLPNYLQKKLTKDYDILVKNGMTPIQAAKRLERALDKTFKGNYFQTSAGIYPDVHKVTAITTGDNVADFVSMPKPKPKIKTSFDGISYVGLKYLKKKFKEAIANPEMEFRHKKDAESLKRIQIYEKFHKPMNLNKFKWKKLPTKKIKILKGVDEQKLASTILCNKMEVKYKW